MPKERTGYLLFKGGTWKVKVTCRDDPKKRDYIDTETDDEGKARAMQKRVVRQYYAGIIQQPKNVKAKILDAPRITLSEFAEEFYEARKDDGVERWNEERGWFRRYIEPHLGAYRPESITTHDLERILRIAAKKGRSQESLKKIRSEMVRMFLAAEKAQLVEKNPARTDLLDTPHAQNQGKKPAAQLTDDEFLTYLAAPSTLDWSSRENEDRRAKGLPELVDRQIQVMSVISRCIGGARTGDLHALCWERVDVEGWKTIAILRPKVSKKRTRIDRYQIPESVQPCMRSWWMDMGCPLKGPVFPIRTMNSRLGKAGVGRAHEKTVSYAKRFKRDLRAAGITRAVLFDGDDDHSPTHFHALRGAFSSALDRAKIGARDAMKLTSHTDWEVHQRYIEQNAAPMVIPDEVLPKAKVPGPIQRIASNRAKKRSEKVPAGSNSEKVLDAKRRSKKAKTPRFVV